MLRRCEWRIPWLKLNTAVVIRLDHSRVYLCVTAYLCESSWLCPRDGEFFIPKAALSLVTNILRLCPSAVCPEMCVCVAGRSWFLFVEKIDGDNDYLTAAEAVPYMIIMKRSFYQGENKEGVPE